MQIKIDQTNGNVNVIRGDGKVYGFSGIWAPSTPTSLTPNPTLYSGTELLWDGSQFIETFPDGKTVTYGEELQADTYYAVSEIEDLSGNVHAYTYDGIKLIRIEVPGGNRVTFLYDGDGHVETVQDWADRRWEMTYDGFDQLLTYTLPTGCQTQYFYPGEDGLVNAIMDPRGYVTSYTFNGSERVETMSLGTATWTYTYHQYDGSEIRPLGSRVESPTGAITTYVMDNLGFTIAKEVPEGYIISYAYDATGNKVIEEMPYGHVVSLTYNASNLPLTSRDPLGNVTTYNYDVNNNLVSLMNALGEVTTMTYDGQRRMTSRMDALGRVTSNVWNTDGTLKAQVDGRGLRTTYAYDAVGNLASTLYADHSVATYTYDVLNRRISAKDPLGRVTTTAYDAVDHVVSIMNAAGEVSTYIYDSCFLQQEVNPLGYRTTYTYERYGKVRTVKNALGQVATTSYDNMGYPVTIQNALGYVTTMIYNDAKQRLAVQDANGNRVTTGYDFGGRPVTFINGEGIVTTTVYDARGPIASQDALGRRTTMIMDALGRRIATQSPMNFRTSTIYDKAGQVRAMQDALGYLTTNSYDAAGNLVTVCDARGYISTQVYEDASNRVRARQDATGARTTYSYDQVGQQIEVRNARGVRTTFIYDLAGRTRCVLNPFGWRTTYSYDAAGQIVEVKNVSSYSHTTIFDALGRVVATQTPLNIRTTYSYDAVGQQVETQDADGFRWTTIYDPAGRAVASQTPLNNRTTTTFDKANRPIEVRNPRGYVTTSTYDLASRVTSQQNPLGHLKQFGYDADGRNVTIANAIGGIITMVYDQVSRLAEIANELDHRTTYAYDPVGNVSVRRFANGDRTTYSYDPVGRQTGRHYADNARVTLTYDAVGNLIDQAENIGSGSAQMTYDAINRMDYRQDQYDMPLQFFYERTGELSTIFDPSSSSFLSTWSRDPDGRIVRYDNPNGDPIEPVYDGRGHKTTISYFSGHLQEFMFDGDGRNVGIKDTVGSEVQRFTYTFDENGNRIGTLDKNSSTSAYVYDALDRIESDTTTGTDAHTYTYVFDSRSNLTHHTEDGVITTMIYDAASRIQTMQIAAASGSYVHDLNGNMVQSGATVMTYDKENRLRTIPDKNIGGATVTFTYDAFSHLREENFGGDINEVYWLGDIYLGERSDPTPVGQFSNIYMSLDGVIMGETGDPFGAAGWFDYLVDYLGSITGKVDGGGGVSGTRRYKPFGTRLSGAAVPRQTFGFTGNTGSRHTAIALAEQYNWYRVYTSWLKQWTTRDPVWPYELPYGYANGNPQRWIDPNGHRPMDPSASQWFWDCMRSMKALLPGNHTQENCFHCNWFAGTNFDCFSPPFIGHDTTNGKDVGRDYPEIAGGINFRYGNYCGLYNIKAGPCVPPPISCIDSFCKVHDDCLSKVPYFSRAGTKCNCDLAAGAELCMAMAQPTGAEWWATKEVLETFKIICRLGQIINFFEPSGHGTGDTMPYPIPLPGGEPLPGTNVGTPTSPKYV